MKICTFCKQESVDDATECPFCGHTVVSNTPTLRDAETSLPSKHSTIPAMSVLTLFCTGIFLMFFAFVFLAIFPPLSGLLMVTGIGFYLGGCWKYTEEKGWNGWLGLFLGLTTIGLIVMVSLENKTKQAQQPSPEA